MMFVYLPSEKIVDDGSGTDARRWTVGHYKPNGTKSSQNGPEGFRIYADMDGCEFVRESDHPIQEDAARRCNWLNGGMGYSYPRYNDCDPRP